MKAVAIQKFISHDVINIPLSIPLSATIGYNICGIKCAGIATATSILDLAAKYSTYSDSYYLTFSSMGALFGKNMALAIIKNYKVVLTPDVQEKTDVIDTHLIFSANCYNIELLEYLLPISISSIGIVGANIMNKVENLSKSEI